MNKFSIVVLICLSVLACSKPPPATSVNEFIEDKALLDAAILRCSENRSVRKTEEVCTNARRAAGIIAAREEDEKRTQLEEESERQREALRQRREREQQRVAVAEEQTRVEQEAQAAQDLIGDSSYVVETSGTLPASMPPGMSVGGDNASSNTSLNTNSNISPNASTDLRAVQPRQTDLCRLDPAGMSDQDLISAYNAFQIEIERRQAASTPVPAEQLMPVDSPADSGGDGSG